jgi:hypothetical protein
MKSKVALMVAVSLAAGMWCYADLILVPYQIADARRMGRPRGNLSDLYPRWLGARELLLHHRDPYSSEVTSEIQAGYYGRPLDSRRPNDPKDQQGFAYPVYVVFLLAPSIWFPFSVVQATFRVLLFFLIATSVLLWLMVLRWRISPTGKLMAIALALGSFPAVQAIKLQQLTALVCVLLAGCAALIVNGRLVCAGVLLAIATIKPQLALPFAGCFLVWAAGSWRSRQRFVWSFLATFGMLIIGGEILLPGWIGRFRSASAEYLRYAGRSSLLDLALTPAGGRVTAVVLVSAVAYVCWRWRQVPADSHPFRWGMALVLSALLTVIPTFAPYNQLLLIPPLLVLVENGRRFWNSTRLTRLCATLVGAVVLLPWLSAVGLDLALLFLPQRVVERAWVLPLWTSWAIPFPVLAAMALGAAQIAKEKNSAAGRVAEMSL